MGLMLKNCMLFCRWEYRLDKTKTSHDRSQSHTSLSIEQTLNDHKNGINHMNEGRKEMFYLTTHSTHFIYGYMASDIW